MIETVIVIVIESETVVETEIETEIETVSVTVSVSFLVNLLVSLSANLSGLPVLVNDLDDGIQTTPVVQGQFEAEDSTVRCDQHQLTIGAVH